MENKKENRQRLICCIIGQDCERFIGMCLESVKDADEIIYVDGGSKPEFWNFFNKKISELNINIKKIYNVYDQEDLGMNGKQRNFYLNYLKNHHLNDWALCLDADEVVENLNKIKEFIQFAKPALYSVHMRHFIGDLGHEDALQEKHWVLHRLFKISEAGEYPETEHPVLNGQGEWFQGQTDCTTIWHLAYIPSMFEIKKRYNNHLKKSNIHTPEFLKQWYYWHLFGSYPRKEFNIEEIPSIILREFGIEPDEIYFRNRNIEFKHVIQVKQWYDYFKPRSVLDLGCGKGPYLYFWKWFVKDCNGIELSEWAVNHAFCNDIQQGDVSKKIFYGTIQPHWNLITAIDLLEHLNDEQLNKTLKNMSDFGHNFLFSIPFIGDINLNKDKTHKQFKTKEEWIKLIESYGIKIKETPKDWLFASQILIGEK